MEEGTDKEYNYRRGLFAIAHINYRNVQMANAPSMHRHVPCAPECVNIIRIPPIRVKVAVSKI